MKKIGLQIGVGLIVGIGALLMTAPQAQAGPPCPTINCGNTCGLCFSGLKLKWQTTTTTPVCVRCDDTCVRQFQNVAIKHYSCPVLYWEAANGELLPIPGTGGPDCEEKIPVGSKGGPC